MTRTSVHPYQRALNRCRIDDRGFTTPCRVYLGALDAHGYGRIGIGSRTDGSARTAAVHRVTWQHLRGPIPAGLEIDHLCRQRDCFEITHLEPVTRRENVMRGDAPEAQRRRFAAQTHCKHGHEFTPENTYLRPSGGRTCRTCYRAYVDANRNGINKRRSAWREGRRT